MDGPFPSMEKICVGNKRCFLEVMSSIGGRFYNFIHRIENNGVCPQRIWNVHYFVGPFVDRPHVGMGT